MCGIVGYVGSQESLPILLEGLRRLEYRGYDSAGVAVLNGQGLVVKKAAGKIAVLEELLGTARPKGSLGIAHTRWATHGEPNTVNAHPHVDCKNNIAVAHNGIIENYATLKKKLVQEGHRFTTDTDTEVIAHLIEKYFKGNLESAVAAALQHLTGTYGIAVIARDDPGKVVGARHGSPLVVGICDSEYILASDVSAIIRHTNQVVYLDDGEMVTLTPSGIQTTTIREEKVSKRIETVDWDLDMIEKAGFAHFMLKEIFEQPQSLRNTLRGRLLVEEGTARLGGLNMSPAELRAITRVVITACGTSWHAGMIGEYMIEELARIPVEVEYASEFRYRNPILEPGTLVIAISQSGETADTLEAVHEIKRRGGRVIALVNVVGSTIARECDGIYLHAGPEISVASTKAFTSMLVALSLLGLHLGRIRDLGPGRANRLIAGLQALPAQIAAILADEAAVRAIAERHAGAESIFFIGRHRGYPIALEGAQKLKEISYIHAEAYPASELKHGPLALIAPDFPSVVLVPDDDLVEKNLSTIHQIRARGGPVIGVVQDRGFDAHQAAEAAGEPLFDDVLRVPSCPPELAPILLTVPLQLLAYHAAIALGRDIDQPRNLAKSVTVA
jgi:glutamine---fructose-6-phosphate transaminase (isomerizing)